MLTDEQISAWCQGALGAPFGRVLFRRQHLSQVVAMELADGRQVVVKARPFEERHAGCRAVQSALAGAGFPCPAPVGRPGRIGRYAVTAETLIPDGDLLSPASGSKPFAALLAQLIEAAPAAGSVPSLWPSPPWSGGRPLAVHDWDSVIAQPEEAIVGLAAAVWPAAGGPGEAASIAQTAAFISTYQTAAGTSWTERQVQMAWTAGLWVRLFNARKDAADGGGPQLDRLADEIPERLARAGLAGAPRARDAVHHRGLLGGGQVPADARQVPRPRYHRASLTPPVIG